MPVIFRYQGFKFFFYSNEGNPLEPAHVHVRASGKEAKFWLCPTAALARNDGFDARTIRVLLEVTEQNRQRFEEAWYDYFA
ncbi:DUF4160 domain-containing protein [Marinobacter subterrani]|jgi:hypothetical protein|uniref:DUF4160 domain-containing protein n=1 Tax=Marinobacter subterrani TaxID=1658765 RepID=A0A0J7J998_9GAMM|nr:DUF4160 domain-containing protein [Marinobacter subterrani]KMQ75033.1 protein of unknown function (DUF4160) [Marinobacter subterrani]